MKKIQLQPREKLIVTIAIAALVGYLYYSLWFLPHSNQITNVEQQNASLQQEIQQNQALLQKEKNISANSASITSEAKILEQSLPSVDAMPSVVEDLQTLFNSNGAEVQNISVNVSASPAGSSPALDASSVQIKFIAGYAQTMQVVKAIESDSQRTFTVSSLTLDQQKGALNASMTVQIYFAKNPLPGFAYQPMLVTQGKANPFQ